MANNNNNNNNATGTTATTTTTTAVTEAAAPPPNEEEEEEEEVPFLIRHDTEVTTATALTATTTIATSSRPPTKVTLAYFIGAVANLCSATLGAGILALPFAMKEAGIVCGVLLLLASGWGTFYSITLLVKACDYYKLATYESIVEKSLGKAWRQIVEISILIFCGGTAIAYVIAVGDILERVQSTHLPLLERKKLAMTVVWFISMLPLSCLKRMQSLQCASSVGIASILTLILAATVHLIRPQDQDPQDDNDDWTSPSFTDLKPFLWPTKGSSNFSWLLAVLRACPIVFFAFSCQVNVCQIYDELPSSSSSSSSSSGTDNGDGRNNANNNVDVGDEEEEVNNNTNDNNKTRSMKWVTFTAVMICATLYLSISIVTLMDFGLYIKPNILSCYKLTSQETLLHVAFVAMAMAVVMAFPLNIFPARVSVIQMIHNISKKPSLALHEEDDGFFYKSEAEQPLLGKNGGDGGNNNNNNNRNYGDLEHCGGGGGVDPLQSPHPTIQAPVQPQLSTLSVEDDDEIDDDGNNSFNIFEHMLVTLLLSGSALGFALVIPNISVVFGLLGGTTSSLLGFVIPGLLGIQMSKSSSDESNVDLGSWILVIAGTLIGLLTTGVTIYSTFL